ncbi:hemagglutinin repeat-containing protein [Achromobacter insolitus]|uniref:hemagglutinin repeat-containing protein n=2 Tax=Achromobacter insolitus TaxID=217204 RepID=UPI0013E2FEAA|nr:hemagglutinin repeat-containing protein [Achromobacter insolitus]NGT16181.1 filamentous hemagglutinin N-terminal domain-containing protein [Achromobacter insolitus]
MISKLRSLIIWSVVFTQVCSPVLAQTLPISVDRNVPGAKPSVGVSNGVPVINIAPPSAGGVSNNRYTQFNVGPSGAVLNNSGGPSQTQLAGQVGGNPMLGNQRARTILNQVTAPNPSQLLGTLEVAGNRANVIVANPAGITCNGCGFLNADRATLTTGKPRVGAEGGIGFDIAAGKIHVDGAGLNGANLSQVDLLARTLQINADVWADRLNVSAGAARVDYGSGAVSAQAGQGAAPELALDTAALGGMYANSVRLIGTEAGVGVNIGGNLVALTGDLQVTAAGDVRIAPRGAAQAAGNLRLDSGRDLTVQGTAQAGGAVALAAARDLRLDGSALAHAGPLDLKSGGDLRLGAGGQLQGQGVRTDAGRDLVLDGVLASTADADLRARRNLHANGKAVANGTLRADAAGNLTIGEAGLAQGSSRLQLGAGQDLLIAGIAGTAGTAAGAGVGARTVGGSLQPARTAGGILQAQAGRDLFITGTATAGSPIVLGAQRDIRLDGIATALEGGLIADAGANLRVGAAGRLQASDSLNARAGADLDSDGVIAAGGGLTLAAGGDILLGGVVAALGERAAGNASITAARDFIVKQNGQLQAAGTLTARADRDLYAAGVLSSVGDMLLDAARDARTDGFAATHANLTLTGHDVTVGPSGVAQAGGKLTASAQGALRAAGRLLAGGSQSLAAGDSLTVDGTVAALQGDLSLHARRGDLALGAASHLQAAGTLTAQAAGALTALGSAATEQGMTLRAGTDATLGGTTATQAGNLVVSAADKLAVTADSRLQAGAALDLSAGGALLNAGIASADTHAKLRAGSALDNAGSVLAGGDLIATASGSLSNAGRFVAGVGADGALNQPGSITLTADAIVHGGTSLAGTDLSLSAGGLNLADGKLSAIGKVALSTPGDVDTRNAVVQSGVLDIAATNLYNQRGKLTTTAGAAIKVDDELDTSGGVIAAAGDARIQTASLVNREGTLAAHDLAITATGALDNRGGLIQADNTLALSAASLDNTLALNAASLDNRGPGAAGLGNRSIPDAARPPTGVLGKVVSLMADRIDNRSGDIQAIEALNLTSSHLDNTGGQIASLGDSRIVADTLRNSRGQLHANRTLTVIVQALQGVGSLQSAGDLGLQHAGSLDQEGDISSGRDLSLVIGGALDNRARVSAGRDLSITADSLNNQASGALLARGVNTIAVAQGLTNAGLIDGGSTRITAGHVDNTGRIYGDAVSLQAGALVNGADGVGSGGAVIASRADLDLGVASLVNRDHALIHADADLRIGGALDGSGHAIGQAASLVNASATIEAAGNADISAASLRNQNDRYASVTVQVSSTPKVYFTPAGTTDMYDAASHWLCDEVTPMCSKDPAWLNDDPERMFLLPSAKYPESRYGPPFDYAPSLKGKGGKTSPITPTYTPVTTVCDGTGGDAGAICSDVPEKFRYGAQERIWSVFGVTPPSGPMPVWTAPERACYNHATCDAEAARRKVYEEAYTAYKAPHMALDARIREFNADFNNRLVGTFTYYQVQETVSETRTLSSDPGKILSGGAMMLTGAVANDKSQIAAGGALTVAGPAIHNIGAGGERIITRVGTATVTQARSRDRQEYTSAYRNTLAGQPIELPVGTSGGNLTVQLNGSRPGASHGGIAPGPVQVASVSLPGATVVRSVSTPAAVPDNQLFAVNGRADAPYLVATDPHFVGQRPVVSSDYLLNLLVKPGAQPGNWDMQAPAGAMFLTPSGQPKRLGDGFYEQKLVSDQILATTGQRFLDTYSDNDSQYKALLAAGAQFARGHGIQLGVALTEAQQRQLTTDLVWLVEQTVTLPDGTTESVLVPQVYLLVREGDLKGDGTLMAGRNVKLVAEGDIVNSGTIGTIGARAATVMTAGNIVNQRGGLIQGATVDLAAREDLTNLVSLIKGDAVTLKAGRDIALTSTVASENFGSTWGTHVSGVARVDAGNLNLQAGRDIALTAAQVSVKDDARLQAGRDIALETLTESHGESLVLNARNRHRLSTSAEIGSTVTAGGNLTLVAGQDVNARAAEVTAGKQLAVGAGRDLHLVAGAETGSAYDEVRYKTKRFLSSKTTHTITSSDWEQAKGSTFIGDTAVLMAGRDLNVVGSNVIGDHDVMLMANRDINIAAATESYKDYQYEKVTKSGFGGGGGFSVGYSKQQRTDWMKGESGGYSSSTVGSVGGNLTIDAGRDVGIFASNVLAQDGDISISGRNVAIVAGVGEARQHEYHEFKQSGITIGVAGGVLGAAQQIHGTLKQADDAKSSRLAAVKVGQAAYQAVQANRMLEAAEGTNATAADKENASAQIQISVGASKSVSETKRTQESVFGSSVMGGGNVSIVALGERGVPGSGNLSIIGSDVTGKNVLLGATNDLSLLSEAQSSTETSTNKNSGWKVGVGIGVSDSGSGGGINIFASGYMGSGNAKGNGTTYRETQISARDNLTLTSGRDTLLEGAQARADSIRADIGRNLTIASQQDTDRYNAKQKQANAGGSFSFGSMTGSAYIGASMGKTKSNYDSVIEQSGLYAGSGGSDVYVGKHTQLDGAVIASDAEGAKNRLSTETLGFTDLKNKAEYKSTTVGVNLGMSGAFDVANKGGANKAGPSGFSFGQTSGSDSGTTYAAIAPGTIEVRSDKDSGRDSTIGLSRDTAGVNGSIGQIFDKDKVREQLEFQQAFGQLGMQLAGDALKTLKEKDPDLWGEGKPGAIGLHAAVAGIGAALGGGNVAGAIAGTVAGDVATSLVREQVDLAVAGLSGEAREQVTRVILNVIGSAAGGAVGDSVVQGEPPLRTCTTGNCIPTRASGLGRTLRAMRSSKVSL